MNHKKMNKPSYFPKSSGFKLILFKLIIYVLKKDNIITDINFFLTRSRIIPETIITRNIELKKYNSSTNMFLNFGLKKTVPKNTVNVDITIIRHE